MTEIETTLLRITSADAAPTVEPGVDTAKRCGELLALLSKAHAAAFKTLSQTVADRRLRRASDYPAAALADAMTDAATLYPKLRQSNQHYLITAIADATNGLEIPSRFLPTERAAFTAAYLFASSNHRPSKGGQKG